jgi:hypothetical protein
VISYNMTFIRLAHTNQIGMRTTAWIYSVFCHSGSWLS